MPEKFLGLGLANIFGLFILFVLGIVLAKVVFNKHEVKGVTDVVNAI